MTKTKQITFMGLLISAALMLHVFEGMLPVSFLTPGAKLGLANIVTIIALYLLTNSMTLTIVVLRILIGSMFGGFSSFLYSLFGGLLSLLAMVLLKLLLKEKVSIVGVSVIGAVCHSIGQIIAAGIIIQNVRIVGYLPVLLATSVGTGIFVGLTSGMMVNKLDKHMKYL